jgi:hypothetical protein
VTDSADAGAPISDRWGLVRYEANGETAYTPYGSVDILGSGQGVGDDGRRYRS